MSLILNINVTLTINFPRVSGDEPKNDPTYY